MEKNKVSTHPFKDRLASVMKLLDIKTQADFYRAAKIDPAQCWVAVVLPGTIIYELGGGIDKDVARKAFNRVAHKLPIRVRMVERKRM